MKFRGGSKAVKRIAIIMLIAVVSSVLPSCAAADDLPHDGVVYSSRHYAGDSVYYKGTNGLSCTFFDEPGHEYEACVNPLCYHNTQECAAYWRGYCTLIVSPKKRPLPLIYMFGYRNGSEYIDGEQVELDRNDKNRGALRVFDVATGEGRVIANTDFLHAPDAWYCDGMIYVTALYRTETAGRDNRVGMIDAVTGEYKELDIKMNARAAGIWNGRLYYITSRGTVYSTDMSLSDEREEYVCGISTIREGEKTPRAFVSEGMLYFERNARSTDKSYCSISDVYAVDLRDIDAGEHLVAAGVYQFISDDGDLYYTLWKLETHGTVALARPDFEGNESLEIRSYDGGSLYRYDAKNGDRELCYSDCGISITEIYDAQDGKIIFGGVRYRLDDGETEIGDVFGLQCEICVSDTETGICYILKK